MTHHAKCVLWLWSFVHVAQPQPQRDVHREEVRLHVRGWHQLVRRVVWSHRHCSALRRHLRWGAQRVPNQPEQPAHQRTAGTGSIRFNTTTREADASRGRGLGPRRIDVRQSLGTMQRGRESATQRTHHTPCAQRCATSFGTLCRLLRCQGDISHPTTLLQGVGSRHTQ